MKSWYFLIIYIFFYLFLYFIKPFILAVKHSWFEARPLPFLLQVSYLPFYLLLLFFLLNISFIKSSINSYPNLTNLSLCIITNSSIFPAIANFTIFRIPYLFKFIPDPISVINICSGYCFFNLSFCLSKSFICQCEDIRAYDNFSFPSILFISSNIF